MVQRGWCPILVGGFALQITIDFSLHQYVSSPTRVTEHSSSVIDHLYSKFDHISEVFVPKIALSDHYPVAFALSSKRTRLKSNEHITISYRCFKRFIHDNFKIDVAHANLNIIKTMCDPNEALKTLYSKRNNLLDKHAPLKCKRVKRYQQLGWYSEDVKQARCLRDKFKNNSNWPQYKLWRNKCSSLI